MTAIMIIVATLFGGLCWAGRSQRRVTYYNQDIMTSRRSATTPARPTITRATIRQRETVMIDLDRLIYLTVAVALASVFVFDQNFSANLSRALGPRPMATLQGGQIDGWQWGLLLAPLAYLLGNLLRRL